MFKGDFPGKAEVPGIEGILDKDDMAGKDRRTGLDVIV